MQKYYILLVLVISFISISAISSESNKVNLSEFMDIKSESFNDIAYLHIVPQYEEKLDPKKAVAIEYFFGEVDDSPESLIKFNHIKEIIEDDKQMHAAKADILAIGPDTDQILSSKSFNNVVDKLELGESKVTASNIPEFLNYQTNIKKTKNTRMPSTLKLGRKFWTLVRFSSAFGGVSLSLIFMDGVDAMTASAISLIPGLASGGLTYYSNAFGAFLTSGKWTTWLLKSDSFFAKKLRAAFNLNEKSFIKILHKNKNLLRIKYPDLYRENYELFSKKLTDKTNSQLKANKIKLAGLMTKFKKAEELFRWWVTEIGFAAIAIKLPYLIAGVGDNSSLAVITSDILMGSIKGFAAQGFGDLAIQKRKYQMIEELREKVQKNLVNTENTKELLAEIEKVLAETGEFKNYTISNKSHPLLVKIENWSRGRATILSFMSVTGVALDIAGIPLGTPMLISVGVLGAGYYGNVSGWLSPKKIKDSLISFVQKVRSGQIRFSMASLKTRFCISSYKFAVNP